MVSFPAEIFAAPEEAKGAPVSVYKQAIRLDGLFLLAHFMLILCAFFKNAVMY